MKKNTKILLAVLAIVVLVGGMTAAYFLTRTQAQQGAKAITVQVVHLDGKTKTVTLRTDAEYLGQALTESRALGVVSEDGPYGIYIQTVDGETASAAAQTYWCLSQNGEMLMVGADQQPIADGEQYELTLTKW